MGIRSISLHEEAVFTPGGEPPDDVDDLPLLEQVACTTFAQAITPKPQDNQQFCGSQYDFIPLEERDDTGDGPVFSELRVRKRVRGGTQRRVFPDTTEGRAAEIAWLEQQQLRDKQQG